MTRPEIRARFRAVVARAIERADAEMAAELETFKPVRRLAPGAAFRVSAGKRPRMPASASRLNEGRTKRASLHYEAPSEMIVDEQYSGER